jgi:MSHA biogenesis protein MshP
MSLRCSRQSGFAAVAAIFLVVILAGLGGFMVSFSNTAQLGSAQDMQGTRAYWAARAGLEWGLASVGSACPTSPTTLSIDSFSVEVTCGLQTYAEAGQSPKIFQLKAVAASAGGVGSSSYVERSVSAGMEK